MLIELKVKVRQPEMPKDGIASDCWNDLYLAPDFPSSRCPGVLMEFNRQLDLVAETNADLQWG